MNTFIHTKITFLVNNDPNGQFIKTANMFFCKINIHAKIMLSVIIDPNMFFMKFKC